MSKQVLQLRAQQALLRTAFEGELQRAAAECANGVEAMQARWRQVSNFSHSVPLRTLLQGFCSAICIFPSHLLNRAKIGSKHVLKCRFTSVKIR